MLAPRYATFYSTTILNIAPPSIEKTLETWGLANRDVYMIDYFDSRNVGYISKENW